MLGRGKQKQRTTPIDTLVGGKSRVTGDVEFTGGFHIDGYIKGNVMAESESGSVLSISQSGMVEGSVSVPHIVLDGTVKGDVSASVRVELGPTARVIGNVYYNLIEMAAGAEVNGKLIHEAAEDRLVVTKPMPARSEESSAPEPAADDDLVQVGSD